MILDWLNDHGQEVVAVAWFNEHWMGKSEHGGRWMIFHFGHGGPLNNGTEGNNGGFKSFALGAAGAKIPFIHASFWPTRALTS